MYGLEDENNFGPAPITQEDGRQVLRYQSKIVSGKEFVFDCGTKGSSKGVAYFKCRGCTEGKGDYVGSRN